MATLAWLASLTRVSTAPEAGTGEWGPPEEQRGGVVAAARGWCKSAGAGLRAMEPLGEEEQRLAAFDLAERARERRESAKGAPAAPQGVRGGARARPPELTTRR